MSKSIHPILEEIQQLNHEMSKYEADEASMARKYNLDKYSNLRLRRDALMQRVISFGKTVNLVRAIVTTPSKVRGSNGLQDVEILEIFYTDVLESDVSFVLKMKYPEAIDITTSLVELGKPEIISFR